MNEGIGYLMIVLLGVLVFFAFFLVRHFLLEKELERELQREGQIYREMYQRMERRREYDKEWRKLCAGDVIKMRKGQDE